MDVRCERCRAQYVFDDDQVTPSGLTVQCTNCGHVFRVKVKELVVTVPVKPGELDSVPIPATAAAPKPPGAAPPPPESAAAAAPQPSAPPAAPAASPTGIHKADEKTKEWRVRQSNGNLFTFKELTTLQKWIVEQKVSRDDEISLSGDQWKRLGNIAELASFFQVVEAAETAKTHAAMPAITPAPGPTVSVYPVVQAPGYPGSYPPGYPGYPTFTPAPGYPPPPPSFAVPPQPAAAPPPPAPRPTQAVAPVAARPQPTRQNRAVGRSVDVQLTEAELGSVKRGRGWKVLSAVVLLAAAGAGGLYLWKPELLGLARVPPVGPVSVPLDLDVRPPVTPPLAGDPVTHPSDQSPPPPADSTPLPAPVQMGEAGLPRAPEPILKPESPKPEPAPKGAKQLLADAERLRERGAVEKALDLYEKVIGLQPENSRALAGRGLCYLDLQQYALAEQSFRSALQADPEEADALLGLAEAARYQGKKSEAIQLYERYLALHPDGEEAVAARNAISQLKE
jgi:predicted Zn finger-like uncharacterized protein